MGGGNLSWEVTPWIWGGLEDEGALLEGVKVLRVGWRKNFTTSSTGLEVSPPSSPCQHLALGPLWESEWGWGEAEEAQLSDTESEGGDTGDTVAQLCVRSSGSTGREQDTEPLLGTAVFWGGFSSLPTSWSGGTWAWNPKLRLRDKSRGCQRCHQDPHG